METDLHTLPDNTDDLKRLLHEALTKCASLGTALHDAQVALEAQETENEQLRERLRLYLQKQYGRSSEQWSADQLQIFNEAEALATDSSDETDEEPELSGGTESAPQTKGTSARKKGRRPLPAWLKRNDIYHDLAPAEKFCPHDGDALECIDQVISEQLRYVPETMEVDRHIRLKWGCRRCEECIRLAALPPQPIPKSMASPSLLAHIAVSKYCDSLPLYRQSTILERVSIDLPRTTMANWMMKIGELVQPVVNLLRDELLAYDILHSDETRCQVLKEPGKAAQSQSYIWAQRGGTPEQPVILFDYDPSRASEVPEKLFAGFEGYLQTDGYDGYNRVCANPKIVRVGCWAHVRRRFDEAIKAQAGAKKASNGGTKAHQGFAFIAKLYRIEKEIRGQDAASRKAARQSRAAPILRDMKMWLDESRPLVPPRSLTGRAIGYALSEWPSLERYIEDGRLEIDNNRVENSIRPFVIGRKNWLFSDTVRGAHASANLYSIIETAKANGLEPYGYLCHMLAELPKATTVDEIETLLPTRWKPAPIDREPAKVDPVIAGV